MSVIGWIVLGLIAGFIGSKLVMLGSKANGDPQGSTPDRAGESQAPGLSAGRSDKSSVGKDPEDHLNVIDDDIPF